MPDVESLCIFASQPVATEASPRYVVLPEHGCKTYFAIAGGAALKFAICNELWGKRDISEVFQTAADLGFAGVEIAPFTLADSVDDISDTRRADIRNAAVDAGVEIVGLHWLFVSPKGLHLTTPDKSVWQRSVEYLQSLTRFCGDVGGNVMVFGSPQQRNIEADNDFESGYQRAVEAFHIAGQTAAERDVMLCFEALTPKETNFINTAEQALQLARDADQSNVGIMLDVKAMSGMPDGIVPTIEKYGSRAAHFHANDPSGKGPGMNGTDFGPILTALAGTDFTGWVSVEPFDYNPDPDTVARTAIETLRAAVP